MIGTTYRQYQIEALLGRGGMGEVYRARDTRLDRVVAIKVMRPEIDESGALVKRFIQEARAASALNHPNIVTIHEIVETDSGELLMVQEFVAGRTLRDLLSAPMALPLAIDVARQLARAMAAAHAAGIVHRDLKPENVVVRPDGYVKVLDFGLATRVLGERAETSVTTGGDTKLTHAGTIVGTTSYMSPEQSMARPVDCPSDVFSLGIVFYEMLTSRRPFRGDSALATLHAILTEHPAPPSRVNPDVSAPLDSLVLAMLAKEPATRPDASAVVAELNAIGDAASAPPRSALADRHTVGRDADRRAIASLMVDVAAGRGIVAAVVGEPGIGKTTLVEDALADLARGPHRPVVARGKCSERLAGTDAYLPILEILDNLLQSSGGGFVQLMKQVAPTWYAHVAPLTAESAAALQNREDIKSASPERMKREIATCFGEISRVRPLVLVLEDLHWADASTIDLLNYVAGRFDAMRVLVIVTYRPSDMALSKHPFLQVADRLRSAKTLVEIPLQFLGRDDVARYLAFEFPDHALTEEFVELIYQRTDGHPLFMVDLLRYLRDRGDLAQDAGRWVLQRPVAEIARELPDSVRSTITRKIDRLDDLDRKLLTAASVQGHEFDTIVVSDVLGLDPADVEDRFAVLDSLHRLVTPVRTSALPDGSLSVRCRFVHVLYQNVLYASLQPTRRASLAGKVAKALLLHHDADADALAAELAILFEAARDFTASARYFTRAARQALALFGFREALSLAERGLAAAGAMADGAERRQRELALQMVKGVALRSTSGWATPALQQCFARARQLCQELGDPPEVFPVLWSITLFHLIRGNLLECRQRADELMLKAVESGDPALLLGGCHMAGVSREFIGEMSESSRLLERARELHLPERHAAYNALYGSDPGMHARTMSSRPLWALGYPDRALARARETVAIAREQREPPTYAFALVVLHGILGYRGDGAEALVVGEQNIALCREHGLPQELEWSRAFQGAALIGLGRTDEGIALLSDSLAVQLRLDTQLARPMFLALLADGFRRAGRVDEGLHAVEEGLAWGARTAEGGYLAELYRMRGELLRAAGDDRAADASLREALAFARAQAARSFELRAATALARLHRDAGSPSEGRDLLAPVYEWFSEGFDTLDLVDARTLLSEMG